MDVVLASNVRDHLPSLWDLSSSLELVLGSDRLSLVLGSAIGLVDDVDVSVSVGVVAGDVLLVVLNVWRVDLDGGDLLVSGSGWVHRGSVMVDRGSGGSVVAVGAVCSCSDWCHDALSSAERLSVGNLKEGLEMEREFRML